MARGEQISEAFLGPGLKRQAGMLALANVSTVLSSVHTTHLNSVLTVLLGHPLQR